MTLNSDQSHADYLRGLHDDGFGGLEDEATIAARVSSDFSQMGDLYSDRGDIPGTATVRTAGTFTDPYAAMEYLYNGGLGVSDGNGDVIPIGFVYFYKYYDDTFEDWFYEVWIDEDTD